ncbi:MmcQ/YjbR family DNA-binding protein [Streptomyces humicola]|uniref:MmcQ/YjbR family DNA-binding protein n=1 Tax=Streptomyces humicola TaxID=2953240 RepID=UPI003556F72E
MTPESLKAACLELNGAAETFPFNAGTSVFKVGGKMFALSALDAVPLSVSLKCDPDLALELRERYPAITGGWHLNKRHWNTVLLDGSVPDRLVHEMIEDSYDLVVAGLPHARQLLLDWPGVHRGERAAVGPPTGGGQDADEDPARRASRRG